jgi:uncharacterized membrane protein YhaH (DUF805 family)
MLLSYGVTGDYMSTLQYLFGFNGRINRAKVWIFLLIVIGMEIVATLIAIFGFDWTDFLKSLQAQVHAGSHPHHLDWCALSWPKIHSVTSMIALAAIVAIVLVYIWSRLAVYVKRLHDRNKSAWWLLLYVLLPGALQIYAHSTGHSMLVSSMSMIGKVSYGVAMLIGLWVFIELYCFRGTKGPNRFGGDPVDGGPAYCDPEKPIKGCIPKP